MKKILQLSTLLLLFAIGFSACEKYTEDTPQTIKKLIKKYEKSGIDIFSVEEYKCCEQIIYCFRESKTEGHCHYVCIHIFDKEGNMLCSDCPRRLQDNNCINEYGDCEETRIIWEKVIIR